MRLLLGPFGTANGKENFRFEGEDRGDDCSLKEFSNGEEEESQLTAESGEEKSDKEEGEGSDDESNIVQGPGT